MWAADTLLFRMVGRAVSGGVGGGETVVGDCARRMLPAENMVCSSTFFSTCSCARCFDILTTFSSFSSASHSSSSSSSCSACSACCSSSCSSCSSCSSDCKHGRHHHRSFSHLHRCRRVKQIVGQQQAQQPVGGGRQRQQHGLKGRLACAQGGGMRAHGARVRSFC